MLGAVSVVLWINSFTMERRKVSTDLFLLAIFVFIILLGNMNRETEM